MALRSLVAAAIVVLLAAACGTASSSSTRANSRLSEAPISTILTPPNGSLYWGAWVPGLEDHSKLAKFQSTVSKTPSILTIYWSWEDQPDFPSSDAIWMTSRGIVPLLMWESWDWKTGSAEQPKYRLSAIADGAFDQYLTRFAQQVKAYGKPIFIAPFHEMNGDWYPWGGTVNGNRSQDLVRAWRHLVDLFRQVGAHNPTWVFVWNRDSVPDGQSIQDYWPGNNYVGWIGLDAYNWGAQDRGGWTDPRATFEPALATLREMRKPILITETGSAEKGGDKSGWITKLFQYLPSSDVAGFVWFDETTEDGYDFRVESSPKALQAFRVGLGQTNLAPVSTK